jgi:hypothetical protein
MINGHIHNYERFTPMNAVGAYDPKGMREIVVGTGGAALYGFGATRVNSVVRNSSTYGVPKLTLNTNSYTWRFVPVAGKTFTDIGTTSCH